MHRAQRVTCPSATAQKAKEGVRNFDRGSRQRTDGAQTPREDFAQTIVERNPGGLPKCERVEYRQRLLIEEIAFAVELQTPFLDRQKFACLLGRLLAPP